MVKGRSVVHVHFPQERFDVLRGADAPLVLTYHGSDVLRLGNGSAPNPLDRLNDRASRIFVVSEFLRRDLLDRRPHLEPKVVCIRNGRPPLPAPPPRRWARGDGSRILFVGDLLPVKGVDLLVRAFGRLRAGGIRCSLTLVGVGPERTSLEETAADLGVAGEVRFRGQVPNQEVLAEMLQADVLVLPSRREGLPNVLLEAMAAGCPVVASTAGGIPEIVDGGRNGLLFPAGDGDALFARLQELLTSPGLRCRLAEGGREYVAGYPDWGQVYERYREHYLEVVREWERAGRRRIRRAHAG
nr:glycosyltransferase family 4 protein [Deferrisoma camini]